MDLVKIKILFRLFSNFQSTSETFYKLYCRQISTLSIIKSAVVSRQSKKIILNVKETITVFNLKKWFLNMLCSAGIMFPRWIDQYFLIIFLTYLSLNPYKKFSLFKNLLYIHNAESSVEIKKSFIIYRFS